MRIFLESKAIQRLFALWYGWRSRESGCWSFRRCLETLSTAPRETMETISIFLHVVLVKLASFKSNFWNQHTADFVRKCQQALQRVAPILQMSILCVFDSNFTCDFIFTIFTSIEVCLSHEQKGCFWKPASRFTVRSRCQMLERSEIYHECFLTSKQARNVGEFIFWLSYACH